MYLNGYAQLSGCTILPKKPFLITTAHSRDISRIVAGLPNLAGLVSSVVLVREYLLRFSNCSLALVLKIPYCVIGYDALSMSFDAKKQTTRAFLHGWSDDDYERLLHFLQSQKDKSFFLHPLLLATRLLQSLRFRTEIYRAELDKIVLKAECQIGYAIPGMLKYRSARSPDRLLTSKKLDFENIVRCLHSCQTELSGLIYVGRFGKELGEFIRKTIEELQKSTFSPPDQVFEELVHQVDFSTNLYATLVSQSSGVLKERVQSHINLVS